MLHTHEHIMERVHSMELFRMAKRTLRGHAIGPGMRYLLRVHAQI